MGETGNLVVADLWHVVLLTRAAASPAALQGYGGVVDRVLRVAVQVAQLRLGGPEEACLEVRPEVSSDGPAGDP